VVILAGKSHLPAKTLIRETMGKAHEALIAAGRLSVPFRGTSLRKVERSPSSPQPITGNSLAAKKYASRDGEPRCAENRN